MKRKVLQIQEVEIPEGKDLLEDVVVLEFSPEDLHEGEGEGKRPYLKGRLGLTDQATANKRLYPRKLMVREINRLSEDMQGRKVFGELDHPGDGKTKLARVSHFVTEAAIAEDGEIKGVIEFIPGTVNGDQALAIAKAGGKLGVSSRGFGTTATDNKGNDVVQEDYKLVTWDIVADPANAGAHPDFVVEHKENTEMMDLGKLKEEHPELVEELTKEIESDARTHAREALREEFEERLRSEGESIREEAVEVARGQLLEDPEVAGSSLALEEIKRIVTPFILSEDTNHEVTKLKAHNQELERKIAEQDEEIAEVRQEAEELSVIAKEFGYHLHLERELRDNERADQIIEMLGDVTDFETLDDLAGRVEEISTALAEGDDVKEEFEDRIAQLEKKVNLVTEQRDKALAISKQFGIRAYIERKISGSPQASRLREHIDSVQPSNKEGVDKLVESFKADNPPSREFEEIRSQIISSRPRHLDSDDDLRVSIEEDVTVMGVPMSELQKRSGISAERKTGN